MYLDTTTACCHNNPIYSVMFSFLQELDANKKQNIQLMNQLQEMAREKDLLLDDLSVHQIRVSDTFWYL